MSEQREPVAVVRHGRAIVYEGFAGTLSFNVNEAAPTGSTGFDDVVGSTVSQTNAIFEAMREAIDGGTIDEMSGKSHIPPVQAVDDIEAAIEDILYRVREAYRRDGPDSSYFSALAKFSDLIITFNGLNDALAPVRSAGRHA